MSNESKVDTTPHRPTPSRQGLYAKAAKHAKEAIDVLVREMRTGDNSNARTGAAKALLAKAIPDLRSVEISGEGIKPVTIVLNAIPTVSLDANPRVSTSTIKSLAGATEGKH